MYCYQFREWLAFFFFYCICGWCFESAYVSIKSRRFVNRGFMKGPWLPIYGAGAILILWLTLPFRKTPFLVYMVGAAGATALEYVIGETMVRLLKVRYWDYSDQKYQFRGHICLSSSITWGFLSLLMVYSVHDPVADLILGMHGELLSVLTFLLTVAMVYDFTNALRTALDLRSVLIQADLLHDELEERLEEKKRLVEATVTFVKAAVEAEMEDRREALEDSLDETIRKLQERQEQLKERIAKNADRLLLQNPGGNFASRRIDSAEIRERLLKLKQTLRDKRDS